MERTEYPDGAPCWVDATVPELEAAQRFYGGLFGWEFADQGSEAGHYTMCLLNSVPVAGLMPPQPGGETVPPLWMTYLSTHDLDAVVHAVTHHGGKVMMGPMDVMEAGRMAIAADPTGAGFGMWQPGAHVGAGRWAEPGAAAWNELITPDGATADAFYEAVFGYQEQRQVGGGDFDYSVWKAGDEQVCGRWQTQDLPPQWMAYFRVTETDEAARKVTELLGRVEHEPRDTPYGRISHVLDPFGAPFSLIGPLKEG
ncbi:VOC family protein [Actinopolymorpha alba]|uniref:VOC family protein n=1 Tax=Actinopolymorpha alba TaxID=533267 RepID=UPI00036A53C1|nr:VOC family protein [Actinopolymorpha alba]